MKPVPVFIDGMVNSNEVVVHSKINFVQVVQNQLLSASGNHWCCAPTGFTRSSCDLTYREIETTLGISRTSLHSILHEHLGVKKICSRWNPHNLSIAQKNVSCRLVERNAPKFRDFQKSIPFVISTYRCFLTSMLFFSLLIIDVFVNNVASLILLPRFSAIL